MTDVDVDIDGEGDDGWWLGNTITLRVAGKTDFPNEYLS